MQCTVRDCTLPLARGARTWTCAAGHSFDISRRGYVNLLQPQDRRSIDAGDSREAVEARASLLAQGVGRSLIDALVRIAGRLKAAPTGDAGQAPTADAGHLSVAPTRGDGGQVVVDLGCGSGDALAALSENRPGIGIDLSTAAIERAARRFPGRTWVVANADRRLPLLDRSIDLVLSLHGRRNPPEVARVLSPAGHLLVVIPAADDLIELRELVQGERLERDRVNAVVAEHESLFEVVDRSVVRERLDLDRAALLNLLQGTYRGGRLGDADRVAALTRLEVTVASDILVLGPRS